MGSYVPNTSRRKPLLRGCHSGLIQSGPVWSGPVGPVGLVGPVGPLPVGPVGPVLVGPLFLYE